MDEEEDETRRGNAADGGSGRSGTSGQPRTRLPPLPTLAPPVTLPEVIRQVYNYWVAKRSRLRRPLLRQLAPTSASNLNPHQVFRQRDKKNSRLRKKRQNDMELYRKMRQLRVDFERVGRLCNSILRRERVNSMLVELLNDYYKERMHHWTDTTGLPRRSRALDRSAVKGGSAGPTEVLRRSANRAQARPPDGSEERRQRSLPLARAAAGAPAARTP